MSVSRTRPSPRRAARPLLPLSLVPDLLAEPVDVLHPDVPATHAERALALEVGERAVHRDARGADERGDVVLRHLDLALPLCRRDVEKALRDPPGDVEEDEVLDAARG